MKKQLPPQKERITASTQVLSAVFHHEISDTDDGLLVQIDAESRVQYAGSAVARLLGVAKDALKGRMAIDLAVEEDQPRFIEAMLAARAGANPHLELRMPTAKRRIVWVEARLVESDNMLIARLTDISERKRREASLQKEARWFQSLTRYSEDAIIVFDAESACIFVSGSVEEVLGYTPDLMTWTRFVNCVYLQDREAVMARVAQVCKEPGATAKVEFRTVHPEGGVRFVRGRFVNGVHDPDMRGFVVYIRDVTSTRVRDPRTRLPNRTFLLERLRQLIDRDRQQGASYALLLVRVDNFDNAVGSVGENAPDQLVVQLGERFARAVSTKATLTHLEADLFGVVMEEAPSQQVVTQMADELRMCMFAPFELGGKRIHMTVSVGISLSDRKRCQPASVLASARAALHEAKGAGRSKQALYESQMATRMMARFGLENELHAVMESGQLELFYQPILALPAQNIAAFEALLRWKHPDRGYVSPGLFIPVAEEIGLLPALGEWVLKTACEQVTAWENDPALPPCVIAVNLSPLQLNEANFLERVDAVLEETGAVPSNIKLELTEGAFIKRPDEAKRLLWALRERGFTLALDDFGTGYSSLSYLHQLPFDQLKIDRSFVMTLDRDDDRAMALVRTIIAMGQSLGMRIVAEGVETEEHEAILGELGCDYIQGYLHGKAVPHADATERLRTSPPPGAHDAARIVEAVKAKSATQAPAAAPTTLPTTRPQISRALVADTPLPGAGKALRPTVLRATGKHRTAPRGRPKRR